MKPVDFKTSSYFPGTIMFVAAVFTVIGLLLLLDNVVVGLILLFVCLLIATTHYRLQVDWSSKTFKEYVWILGMKHGTKTRFDSIEYIFIKKSKVVQTMHVRVASTTFRKEVFDGYLKFSDQQKVHLLTVDKKSTLLNKLHHIASALNVEIIDHTESVPHA